MHAIFRGADWGSDPGLPARTSIPCWVQTTSELQLDSSRYEAKFLISHLPHWPADCKARRFSLVRIHLIDLNGSKWFSPKVASARKGSKWFACDWRIPKAPGHLPPRAAGCSRPRLGTGDDKNIRKLASVQSYWAVSRDIAVICRHQAIFGWPADRDWRPLRDDTIWVFCTDLVIKLPERSRTRRTSGCCRKVFYASMIFYCSLWSCIHIWILYIYIIVIVYVYIRRPCKARGSA